MAKRNEPFAVKIWTSSHGLPSHHFPQSLKAIFEENDKIKFPSIDAKGGRMITDDFVANYISQFDQIRDSSEPQISVLLLGDNDIRKFAKKGAFKVFRNTKQIIETHKGSCHPLLLLGIMPSPKTHALTLPMAEYLDDVMQAEIAKLYTEPENKIFAFVCTSAFFSDKDGFLLNRKYFMRDGVHLNETGAMALAANIIENTKILVDTIRKFD